MTRYIAVHGHAYQPPRENPRTGEVDAQPSAAPFHDWNERITSECYAALAAARIDTENGPLHRNLWGDLGFDLGATLGIWMDRSHPEVAAEIAVGDARSHGAIAHPWVHAILPLMSAADRRVLLHWGRVEFATRLGRTTEGIWFPETAVNTATLEAAADAGFTWTILAPHQIRALRPDGALTAPPLSACRLTLPSGRWFDVLPYHGPTSHDLAFGALLDDGERLADRMIGVAQDAPDGCLVLAAVDMETFGHHHRFGEMAVAKAVEELQRSGDVQLVTPEQYLELVSERTPAVLVEPTSWSCAHGVGRWRENCGCRFETGTDQSWRGPLRDALNALTSMAHRLFLESAEQDLLNSTLARDDYGALLAAGRTPEGAVIRERFLSAHARTTEERALMWMEAERMRLEAWSSCAWFFDSIDRVEPAQVLAQAGVAIELYSELSGQDLRTWWSRIAPVSRPTG